MRGVWLHILFLVVATVVSHDVYMATTGHALISIQDAAAAGRDQHHQGHAPHAPSIDGDRAAQDGGPAHCDPVRVVAPLNRDMSPSFDTVSTALLPDPAILMRFASTSRVIVASPLPHPPDLNRAYFQVYRI